MSAARAFPIVSCLARDGALPPRARRVTARPVVVRAATSTAPKPATISDRRVGDNVVGSPAASSRDDAGSVPAATGSGPSIPVVDLDASDEACASVVREALFEGVGFFHVRNHGVPRDALENVAASAKTFFDAPFAEKRSFAVGDMKLSRGYEMSPEHIATMFSENHVSLEHERADPEPSAARRIVGERFSVGPFGRPSDAYHAGEDGATFFAPIVFPKNGRNELRESMESYYEHMERLSNRILRLIALAANAPPDFFEDKTDRHCSNLQVANYPTLRAEDWREVAEKSVPPRKKAHADSGTITILARSRSSESSDCDVNTKTKRGGLQVLVGDDTWADVPTLAGGARDGEDGVALLVNVGNQLQAWSDGIWRSTKHRVANPDLVDFINRDSASLRDSNGGVSDDDDDHTRKVEKTTRRVSVAFFHKANYDAAVDPKAFLAFGGFGAEAAKSAAAKNVPVRTAGELSRVGMLRAFAKRGMDAEQASMAYHEALMGAEAAAEAAGFKSQKRSVTERGAFPETPNARGGSFFSSAGFSAKNKNALKRGSSVRRFCRPPVVFSASDDGLGFDRGSDDRGAGLGNDTPSSRCPVCKGTGWKPCGQCDGTGVNQDDLFGGKFLKGDTCWLCSGKAKTMCGNCIDLTDSF